MSAARESGDAGIVAIAVLEEVFDAGAPADLAATTGLAGGDRREISTSSSACAADTRAMANRHSAAGFPPTMRSRSSSARSGLLPPPAASAPSAPRNTPGYGSYR